MEDYSRKVGIACMLLILMLIVMGYIPALSIGGIELKRVDILSEVRSFDVVDTADTYTYDDELINDEYIHDVSPLELDEDEYEIDMLEVSATVAETFELVAMNTDEPIRIPSPITSTDIAVEDSNEERIVIDTTRILKDVKLTPIEDFDTTGLNPLHQLYAKLNNPNTTVRIALLGDSFVEGDILSCDLRAILQSRYGGQGSGFAPLDSPLTRYRRTVRTTSSGWTTHNIMQKRTTPEDLASRYYVSGWVSHPQVGASTKWSGSDSRQHLATWNSARFIFMSREGATIETSINGAPHKTYNLEAKDMVQQIKVEQEGMSSFEVKLTSGDKGFIGYGAIFDGGKSGGVVVDNYSVRSNNGQAILWTNPSINVQIDHLVGGYDLVILQYGLNIMQKGVNNYTRYGEQIQKMIAYVRECFPYAAVLVMGVSDRSMKENGAYVAMSEARNLTRYQRDAAHKMGAAFWSTYDAMRAQGGMSNFVKQEWAAKDFTHINFAGGRQIAMALVDAFIYKHYTECPPIIRKEYESIIPEKAKNLIGEELIRLSIPNQ